MKTIAEWQRESHALAVRKDFWKDGRDNIWAKLFLIGSEVHEAGEELRNGHNPKDVYYKDGKPEGFPIELADTVIRICDLAEYFGIDLESNMDIKMMFNATRPDNGYGGKTV